MGFQAQLHDFSPGNGEDLTHPARQPDFGLPGLFWMVRLDEDSFEFEDDGTAVLKINNLLEFDRLQLLGPGDKRMHLTFDTTYHRLPGPPTKIAPLPGSDPAGAYHWAGTMWDATAKGKFHASYDDGTFAVSGIMDSAVASPLLPWQGLSRGHMGHERNGFFVQSSDKERHR